MSDTVNPFPYFWTHKERETLTLYRTTPPVLGHVEQKGREKGIIMLFWVKRIRKMVNFELEHVLKDYVIRFVKTQESKPVFRALMLKH